jgi:hypothetical protein
MIPRCASLRCQRPLAKGKYCDFFCRTHARNDTQGRKRRMARFHYRQRVAKRREELGL